VISKNEIKAIRTLHQKKFRDRENQFLVEGEKQVKELLNSKYVVKEVYATKDWEGDVAFTEISQADIERITTVSTPNKVVAIAYMPEEVDENREGVTLALDGVRDPGNMGTIIRAASWFGVNRIICSDDCVDAYNPKVVRSSMGALFKVAMKQVNLLEELEKYSCPKIGLVLGGDCERNAFHVSNCIIVMGSEAKGISPGIMAALDKKVELPGSGNMESLNVAMSATIALYENFVGVSQQ
jgi:TrmH family RNA methyltransferase